jgi:hypothetical protein
MDAMKRKDKFLARIEKDLVTGCWNWMGMKNAAGYGWVKRDGKFIFAHRYSYTLLKGEIGEFFVLHKCDNRACVNPVHLFLGTQKDNQQDMKRKGRHVFGERSSQSKLTEKQVIQMYELHEGGLGTILLARQFGVTKNLAWMIVRGKVWNHLYVARYGTNDAV